VTLSRNGNGVQILGTHDGTDAAAAGASPVRKMAAYLTSFLRQDRCRRNRYPPCFCVKNS
jgi:hypothetical protein